MIQCYDSYTNHLAKMKKQPCKVSSTPLMDNISGADRLIDNELDLATQYLSFFSKTHCFGLVKNRGYPIRQVLFSVLIWPLLGVPSLHFFCGKRLSAFIDGGKDVLYDFLKRQDINWRGFRLYVALQLIRQHNLGSETIRAAVVDDTIKHRRGTKVSAVSSHFDHTLGKQVMGQQMLEMGLATPKGNVPLDSRIYVSEKRIQDGKSQFRDKRSSVARDCRVAKDKNKNEMFRDMLKRSIRKGIAFTHVMGDSWFGNKENIKSVISAKLTGIFRMKKGNLKYRINGKQYTATEVHLLLKRRMKRLNGSPYRTCTADVQMNLSNKLEQEEWVQIRLLFSSPVNQYKDNWAVFLSTDVQLDAEKILQLYSLRWSIEVYFKEIKQHLGFLKEQSGDYAVHYASIHLCAIRYLLIVDSMLRSGEAFGKMRNHISGKLEMLTFARLLWELFKALICGALDSLLQTIPQKTILLIKYKINETVCNFLNKALQLDEDYLFAEQKAEAIGILN